MSGVSKIIKSIQDIMRKDVGVDGDAQRIGQLVWMFFLKIFDDREAELELLDEAYVSPLPEHMRWRNWARDREGITGEALVSFVNDQLFPTLKNKLHTHGPAGERARVIRGVFEDAYNYMKSGTLLRQIINKISEIDFNNTADRHTFGSIYEQILKDLQSAGNAGEFYTPRAVTRFIVDRVDPKLAEVVLDPACGTGGFLTCAIEHKRANYVRNSSDEQLLSDTIRGVEKKALPHMLAVTNLILHGIDAPTQIRHDNTLARPYKDYGKSDRVDVILTNPPFGGMEEDGIENNFPAQFRTRETADLFVALIIKLLKDGGRAAVVLPDGFLFGEGMKTRLKQSLLEDCNLHTIIRLPSGVFNPYTSIKTNLLFFTKGAKTEDIWFFEHPFPEGVTSYNKTRPMVFEEFQLERDWWGREDDGFVSRVQNQYAWRVSASEVAARNYNLDFKNPHIADAIRHDASELVADYQGIMGRLSHLEGELSLALRSPLSSSGAAFAALACNSLSLWTSSSEVRAGTRSLGGRSEWHGIQKLREMILGLAVQGRLVPQNAQDGFASSSLAAGRAKLASESKGARRSAWKETAPVAESDQPFQLPAGWAWGRVNDTGFYVNGLAFKPSDWGSSGKPIIRIQNLTDPTKPLNFASGEYPDEVTVRPGDLLVSWSATLDAFLWAGEEGVLNQHIFKVLPCYDVVDHRFLYWMLKHAIREMEASDHAHGLVMTHINREPFLAHVVAIPPLPEQRRISAEIDRLMGLCDELSRTRSSAQSLLANLADAIVEQGLH